MMNNYGLSEDNPIKIKDPESVITVLKHIVTEAGFHLLYHLKEYISKGNSRIEVYEIFSGIEEFCLIYFDVTNDNNAWISPTGFLFKYDWIEHGERNFIYHGQDYYYKGDESVEKPMAYFRSQSWKVLEIYLMDNYGVNYNCLNFPKSVYQMYYDYGYSDVIKD